MPDKDIASLLNDVFIDEIALPSNIRYGTAIQRRGGVEFITRESSRVEAWVGGLDGPGTEDGKLAWHCAGNPKNHQIFCKHCVALALAILDKRSN